MGCSNAGQLYAWDYINISCIKILFTAYVWQFDFIQTRTEVQTIYTEKKISPQSYKTQIKILAYPGLA